MHMIALFNRRRQSYAYDCLIQQKKGNVYVCFHVSL